MARSPGYSRLGNSTITSRILRSPSKPDRVHICTISVDAEPSLKLFEDTVDSGGSSEPEDFLENAVNSRSRELLQVIEKIRGECVVIKQRERAREEKCEELRSKCEAAMTDFEKNPTVVGMRDLSALESKVASLEVDKARLKAVEASLKKKVDDVKHDKMEVVLKVVPYAAMELVHNDELGYRLSYKKEHTQAGNELATTTFPWLSEFVADPSSPIKVLLSKKPPAL
nr:hypothetical protein [Tanacetum cinerariifolium]